MKHVKTLPSRLQWMAGHPLIIGVGVSIFVLAAAAVFGEHSVWLVVIPIVAAALVTIPAEFFPKQKSKAAELETVVKIYKRVYAMAAVKNENIIVRDGAKPSDTVHIRVSFGYPAVPPSIESSFFPLGSGLMTARTYQIHRQNHGRQFATA